MAYKHLDAILTLPSLRHFELATVLFIAQLVVNIIIEERSKLE
jgi:hypothetical protein